jgi:capsular polysaccharide biosynthesis protein
VSTSAHALIRFWWLILAGLIVGGAVAMVVYRLEAKPKHTATTNLFVNSPSAPFLRTQPPGSTSQKSSATKSAPDTETLVTAANTYPQLIQSDVIAKVREAHYGAIPGTVTANALNATTNSFGVYRPSPLPVIQVKATSKLAGQAEQLDDATVAAFQLWMRDQQRAHGVPNSERISVQQLESPVVETTGGRSKGLPIFIGALVFLAFCGLAVVLDSSRPAAAAEPAADRDAHAAPTQHSLEG